MITLIKRTHKDEYEEEIYYYVPKEYEYQRNGERIQRGFIEDAACKPPHVKFDDELKKWALHFSGTDFGGYDAQNFVYYFDNLNDILIFIEFPLAYSCLE